MNKLSILVVFTFSFSLLSAQDPNKNVFSQDEVIKLSNYAIELEKSILDNNPSDTALIAKLKGDYLLDLYGYSDEAVIKISNYLKELEKAKLSAELLAKEKELAKAEEIIKQQEAEMEEKFAELLINPILFDVNSSNPKEIDLFSLIYDLQLNKKLTVLLVGHTDASGSDNFNLNLSIQRATAVKRYLVNKGMQASRITIKGEGEWQPVAENATEAGRAKNRRVEISVK